VISEITTETTSKNYALTIILTIALTL